MDPTKPYWKIRWPNQKLFQKDWFGTVSGKLHILEHLISQNNLKILHWISPKKKKKICVENNFELNKTLGPGKILTQKQIMGHKKTLGKKNVCKKNLNKKEFLVKIYFGQNKFWD